MERTIRTDLASEGHDLLSGEAGSLPGVRSEKSERRGFSVTTIYIDDAQGEKALCKPIGKYQTVELDALLRRAENAFEDCAALIGEILREQMGGAAGGVTLVAGLGNAAVTPDAVGPMAADCVMVTRHLKEKLPKDFAAFASVAALRPGVLAVTGVESAELIKSVCAAVSPARVIAVDALASADLGHLCRCVQISDAGIVPGSGVGNDRAELCKTTLGVPVLAVGVPTVVDASLFTDDESARGMFVTPRGIDASVRDISKLVGYGINLALHDGLTIGDVDMFLS